MFNKRRRGSNNGDFAHISLTTPIGASSGGSGHHGNSGGGGFGGRQPAFNSDNFPSSRKSTPKNTPSETGSQYSGSRRSSAGVLGSRLNRLGGGGGGKSRKKQQEEEEDQQARKNLLDDQSVGDSANHRLEIPSPSTTGTRAVNTSLNLSIPSLGVGSPTTTPHPTVSTNTPSGHQRRDSSSAHQRRDSSSAHQRRESTSAHQRRRSSGATTPKNDLSEWPKSRIVVPPPPDAPRGSNHARTRRPSNPANSHAAAASKIVAREHFLDSMMEPEPPSQTHLLVDDNDADENDNDGELSDGDATPQSPIRPNRPAPPSAPATPVSSGNISGNKVKKSKMEKIQELLAMNKELRKNCRNLKVEMEAQSKLLEDKKQELQLKAIEMEDYREEQQLHAVAAASSEELERVSKELDRAKQEASRMRRELGQKKREITSLQKELDSNMKEVAGLRSTLNETLEQVDALEDEQDKDKAKLMRLTRELTVARRGNAAASFDQEEMEQLRAQLDDAKSELDHAQSQLDQAQSELARAQSSIRDRDRVIESQRQEVDSQVDKILKLQAELDKKMMDPPSSPKTPPPPLRQQRGRSSSPGLGDLQARQIGSSSSDEEDIRQEYESRLRDLEDTERLQADIIADQRRDWNRLQNEKDSLLQELEHTKKALYQSGENKTPTTVSASESEVEQLRMDTDMLQTALREANDRNRELEERLAKIELEDDDDSKGSFVVHGGFKPLSDTKSAASDLQRELVQLEKELEAAREDKTKAEEMSRLATSRLNIEMLSLQKEFEEAKSKCTRLEEEAVDLREARDDLEVELQRIATQNADLQQKADSHVHQARALSSSHAENLSSLEMENKTLCSEKRDLESRVLALNKEVNTWKVANGRIKTDFQESEKKVKSMEESVRECENVREESASLKERNAALESSLEKLREELNMAQERALSMEMENKHAVTQVGSSTAERDDWKAEAEKAIAECASLRPIVAQHNQLKQDHEVTKTQRDELQRERDNLESQLFELARNRDDWKESTEQFEGEAAVLRAKATLLEDTERDLAALESEADELRLFKAQANIQISELRDECDDLREVIAEAQRDVESARERSADYETSIEDSHMLHEETEELRKHVSELESKVDKLEGDLVEARETAYNLADELDEARAVLPQLQEAQADLEAVEFEAEQLRELTKLQETEVEDIQQERDELQHSLDELKEAVANERASVARSEEGVREELLDTQQRLSAVESRVVEYESERLQLADEAKEWKAKALAIEADHDETRSKVMALEQTSDEYGELQEEAEMLGSRVRELEAEIEELTRQRDEWRAVAEDEEQGVAAGQSAMEALQHLQRAHAISTAELEALRQKNEAHSEEVKNISTERDEWQQKTETLVSELESAQTTIGALEQTEDDLFAVTEEAERLERQVTELEEQLAVIVAERDQLIKDTERSHEETVQTRALFESKDTETMTMLTELQEESRRIGETNDMLQADLDTTKADLDAWKQAAAKSEADATDARTTVTNLEAEVERLRLVGEECETLREGRSQLETQNQDLRERATKLESDVKQAETVADDLRSKLEHMKVIESELSSQKNDAQSAREEFVSLQQALEAASAERDEWKTKAESTTSDLEEAQQKFSATCADSEQQISDLERLNEQLASQVAELEEDVDAISKTLEEVSAREANLKLSIARQNENFEQRMVAADKTIAEARGGSEDLVGQLEEVRLELERTREEKNEAIAASTAAVGTIADLEGMLKDVNAKLQNAETEMARTREETTVALESAQQERDQWERRAVEAERACDGLKESNDIFAADARKLERELNDVHEAAEKATLANVIAQEQIEALRSSKTANESLQKECDHYRSEHSVLEAQLVSVKRERDEWRDAAETNKTQASHAVASVATSHTEIADLRKKMENLEKQNSRITSDLKGAESDRNELSKSLDNAKAEVAAGAAMSQLLTQLEADKSALEANVHDLQTANEQLRTEIRVAESERDASIAQAQQVQEEADEAVAFANAKIAKAESEFMDLEDEMEALRTEKEDFAQKVGQLSQQVMEHQQADADQTATTTNLQEQLRTLRSKADEHETQIGCLREERDSSMAAAEKARAEADEIAASAETRLLESEYSLDEVRKENSELQVDNDEIKKQVAELSAQVSKLQASKEEHAAAASKARALADDTAREADTKLAQAENDLVSLQKRNDDLSAEKDDYAEKVGKLTLQLMEMQQQASVDRSTTEQEVHSLRIKIGEFEMKVESLEKELDIFAQSEAKARADIAQAESGRDSVRKENANLAAEKEDYAEKVGKLTLQLMEMQQQVSADRTNTEEEVQNLRVEIGELEVQVESLQKELEQSTESTKKAITDADDLRAEMESRLSEAESERDQLRVEAEAMQIEMDEYADTVASLSGQIKDLEQASTEQVEARADLEEEVRLFELRLEEKEFQLASLETERDDSVAAEKARGEAELAKQQEELVELRRKMERLQEDKDDYAEKVAQLSIQVMELQAAADHSGPSSFDSSSYRDDVLLNQTQNELALLRVEADKLREDNASYSSKVKSLSADLLELQADKHDLSRYSDEDENQPVTQQSGESVEELAELRTTVQALQQQLDDLSQERDQWKSQAAEQQNRGISRDRTLSTSTSSRYMDASMMMDQLHKEMDELRLRNMTNQNEIQRLVEERDRWRQKAEAADIESVAGQSTRSESPVLVQLEELRERNGALERQLELLTQDRWNDPDGQVVDDLRTRNKILESQIEILTSERDDWKEKARAARDAEDNQSVATSVSQQQSLLLEAALSRKRKEKSVARRNGTWFRRNSEAISLLDETLDEFNENSALSTTNLDEQQLRNLLDEREAKVVQLKKELVQLNMSLKEENHRNQKSLERLDQENSAYEIKIHALEDELERLSAETSQEIQDIQEDFEALARNSRTTQAGLEKELQAAKKQLEALEKIIQALDHENESIREVMKDPSIAEKRDKVHQDAKDVQIAQFHYELVNLRMQLDTVRHEDLQKRVTELESEKLGFKHEMEDKMHAAMKENEEIVELLQNKLRTKESTIVMLEEQLEVQMQRMANAL